MCQEMDSISFNIIEIEEIDNLNCKERLCWIYEEYVDGMLVG